MGATDSGGGKAGSLFTSKPIPPEVSVQARASRSQNSGSATDPAQATGARGCERLGEGAAQAAGGSGDDRRESGEVSSERAGPPSACRLKAFRPGVRSPGSGLRGAA